MPIGILNDTDGAEVGVITNEITFDDVIALYFSLKSEYRTKGSWLINDEIAKNLYTLKDADGNYVTQEVTYPKKYTTDVFKTDEDGSVHLPAPLKYGEYKSNLKNFIYY